MLPAELEEVFALAPEGWEASAVGRREMCRDSPLAFALVYLRDSIKLEGDVSFSRVHVDWADYARRWMTPTSGPTEHRDMFVAPRGMGKSTWFFLILPLWAAAFGHKHFVAAFSDSAQQAEQHLQTFRHTLQTNQRIRADFPDLVRPGKGNRGATLADNRAMIHTATDFVFAARGIDSSSLGMKVGNLRPDLLILDDVESDESNYSEDQARKRLVTLSDSILQLNIFAHVVWVGTTTMPGSLVDQAVQSVTTDEPAPPWLDEDNWRVHYSAPILTDAAGTETSVWPEKWPIEFLDSIRATRGYAKNYANRPVSADGDYWQPADIHVVSPPDGFSLSILSIDPAVTTKTTSDYTAIALLGWHRDTRKVYVRQVWHVRLAGAELKRYVADILALYPDVSMMLVETNQGGEAWRSILGGLPVRYLEVHQSLKKEFRAGVLLAGYQRGLVEHTGQFPILTEELLSFPKGVHDDLVDAVGTGYIWLNDPMGERQKGKPGRLKTISGSYA